MSSSDQALYGYALNCALNALISHASWHGRGWYVFAGGDLVIASEVVLEHTDPADQDVLTTLSR